MGKMTAADKMRNKFKEKTEKAVNKSKATKSSNPNELKLDFGTYKVRFLPPIKDDDYFYASHSYHYVDNEESAAYVFSNKRYGKKQCPFDEAVAQMYETGRNTDDAQLLKQAGSLKRKRNYYSQLLLLDVNGEEVEDDDKYKVLIETSNKGKLTRQLCKIMGIPFFKDIEDNWVDDTTTNYDADEEYFDLIDMDSGYDLKITKEKTGKDPWDFDYKITVLKKNGPRPLTKAERAIVEEKRVDLTEYVTYIDSYDRVYNLLQAYLNGDDVSDKSNSWKDDDDEDDDTPKKKVAKKKPVDEDNDEEETPKKKVAKKKPVDEDDDDDNDEYVAPSKTSKKKTPAKDEDDDEDFEKFLAEELDEDDDE